MQPPSAMQEKSQHQGDTQTATVNDKQINLVQPRTVFTSIKIDHFPGRSRSADYSVTLYSNGSGLYEGRSNVHIIGTSKFDISKNQLNAVNQLCIRFFAHRDEVVFEVEKLLPIPVVVTTYTPNDDYPPIRFWDRNDNDDPSTARLIAFRTTIEQIINTSRFTKGDRKSQEAIVAM